MRKKLGLLLISALLILGFFVQLCTTNADYGDSETYIAVELLNVDVINDLDDGKPGDQDGSGELELATFVYAEGVKEQSTIWPRKDQSASWQEVDTEPVEFDRVVVNTPIFIAKESQIGDEMAIIVAAVENDESSDWVEKVWEEFLKVGPEVAKLFKAPGWITSALKASQTVTKFLDSMAPDAEKYGVYTRILLQSDWEEQIKTDTIVYERAQPVQVEVGLETKTRAEFYVRYKISRVEVPTRTPSLAVKLVSITSSNWDAGDDDIWGLEWDDDGGRGEVMINTRAYNDVTIDAALVQTSDYGTHETPGGGTNIWFPEAFDLYPGDTWTPPEEFDDGFPCSDIIYSTDAIGSFLHLEISVWDKDKYTHDIVGRYSNTFWPDENWAIGQTITATLSDYERGRNLSGETMTIVFEIIALPFSNVQLTATTSEVPVEPGETITTNVLIVNRGSIEDTYSLWVEGLDVSWCTWDAFPTQTLAAGASATRYLYITPPRKSSTSPGRYEFKVKATTTNEYSELSTLQASDTDTTAFKLKVFYDVEIFMPSEVSEVQAGHNMIYTIGVKNRGNTRTDFKLSVECLDFDESWATLVPDTVWDVDAGKTVPAFLIVSVAEDYSGSPACHFTITASCLDDDTVSISENGEFSTIPIDLDEVPVEIKLDGELDYLFREDVKIKISAFITDVMNNQPVSGLSVSIKIYYPDGTVWITSEPMVEVAVGTGVYEWQSSNTILELMQQGREGPKLIKGVYIALASTTRGGQVVYDIAEFHIDPPAEIGDHSQDAYLVVVTVALAAALFFALAKRKSKSYARIS
jgi:hypothetical protein